jgi:hypothetical protein
MLRTSPSHTHCPSYLASPDSIVGVPEVMQHGPLGELLHAGTRQRLVHCLARPLRLNIS